MKKIIAIVVVAMGVVSGLTYQATSQGVPLPTPTNEVPISPVSQPKSRIYLPIINRGDARTR